jgi:serine/threonine protein phosphatase PrpC
MWRRFRLATKHLINEEQYAGNRIQGQRQYQQDDFGFDNRRAGDFLMILADGMGGHSGGDIASKNVVTTFMDSYHNANGTVAERLFEALETSNQAIAYYTNKHPEFMGMGSTLVAFVINQYNKMQWISVGDSPLWLYSHGELSRLNADHSMKPLLEEQVRLGKLTAKQAAEHPDRNMLRSAVIGTYIKYIDQSPEALELYAGDTILLASDGIFTLSDTEISKILKKPLTAKNMVNTLLDAVEKKNKRAQDNTTALVFQMPKKPNFFRRLFHLS